MPRTHATVAISLHPDLREEARQRAQELGFGNSFSAYVAKLIAEDIRAAGVLHDAAQTAAAITEHAVAAASAVGKPVSYTSKPARKRAKKPQLPPQ